MKAKTVLELLAVTTNLYAMSKDKELIDKLTAMAEKGKDKIEDFVADFKENDEESILAKLVLKAQQAKEEFEHKMEDVAERIYKKMQIAHINDIKDLQNKIDQLNVSLYEAEQKIKFVEQKLEKA